MATVLIGATPQPPAHLWAHTGPSIALIRTTQSDLASHFASHFDGVPPESMQPFMDRLRAAGRTGVDRFSRAAVLLEAHGLLARLSGVARKATQLATDPKIGPRKFDPFSISSDHFLLLLRLGVIERPVAPRLKESTRPLADDFLSGALEVFADPPSVKPPRCLNYVAKAWATETARGLDSRSIGPNIRARSRRIGRESGTTLKGLFLMGQSTPLASSQLEVLLHRRDVPAIVAARGWLLGSLLFLSNSKDPFKRTAAGILAENGRSLSYRLFSCGDLAYLDNLIAFLPRSIQEIERTIRSVPAEMAEALGENRDTLLHRTLLTGDFNYPDEVIKKLPAFLRGLRREREKAKGMVRKILESNRPTIIYQAIASHHLDDPAAATRVVQELLWKIRHRAKRLRNRELEKILLAYRGTIISHILGSGDAGYLDKVIRELPRLLQDLKRAIRQASPELKEILIDNRKTILNHVLSSDDFQYVHKVVRALPLLLRRMRAAYRRGSVKFRRFLRERWASILYQEIASGNFGRYFETVTRDYFQTSSERAGMPVIRSRNESPEEMTLGKRTR